MPKHYTDLSTAPATLQGAAIEGLLASLGMHEPDAEDLLLEVVDKAEGLTAEIVTDNGMVYSVRLKVEIVCEGRRSCSACGGSGEGWRPESACQTCGGSGYATPARAED